MKFETNIQGMKDTLAHYRREWTKKNLEVEIKIAEGGRITFSTEERKIKEYSISSINRRRFLMYIIRATYEDTSLTVTQLVKLLGCSRQAIETMIIDCADAKWIKVEKSERNLRSLTANKILIDSYEKYTYWLWSVYDSLELRNLSIHISQLQKDLAKSV
ncbi:MAG: hypothetical protein CBC71_10230 [Rhodobacteraceae bacterium TMED111]|nr:hypothetical protein [Marinovum sp.]OUV38924.1 MAG: hypothetical protein CBC71_10230 [Rhodobacteraceae bacterium TMED111]